MLETPETTATLARQLQETTGIEAIDLDRQREGIEIERMAVLRVVAQEKQIPETGEETTQEIQGIPDGTTVEMMGASAMMIETQETVAMTVEEVETIVEDTREAEKTMRQRQEAGVRAATDHRRGMRRLTIMASSAKIKDYLCVSGRRDKSHLQHLI